MSDPITMSSYSAAAREFRIYPNQPEFYFEHLVTGSGSTLLTSPLYPFMKISGEAGELTEKVAKSLRDPPHSSRPPATPTDRDLLLELGDILWYLDACAAELGSSLEEVARMNLEKLTSRRARGTISGSGDHR